MSKYEGKEHTLKEFKTYVAGLPPLRSGVSEVGIPAAAASGASCVVPEAGCGIFSMLAISGNFP
jgi:hypothetical protein